MKVFKYRLSPFSLIVRMPVGAQLLHVDTQEADAYVWALVDPDAPECDRKLSAYPTGAEVCEQGEFARFVGTFKLSAEGRDLVFLVFDRGEA